MAKAISGRSASNSSMTMVTLATNVASLLLNLV